MQVIAHILNVCLCLDILSFLQYFWARPILFIKTERTELFVDVIL